MIDEDAHLLTTRIAQRLRDAGLACDIVNLVPTPKSVLRRDRIIVVLALALLTGLGWSYLLWLSADMSMGGMDMTSFRMIPAGQGLMMPASEPWKPIEFGYVLAMWVVMMIGMMTPSVAPMILIYARVGRQAVKDGKPFAATAWFAGGYLLAWLAFSLMGDFGAVDARACNITHANDG
jgi:predicted metal-binding membrane protein